MSDIQETEVTGHVYDGIQEYDNPLPGWWTAVFWMTILFSIGYVFINFAQPGWVDTNLEYEAAVIADTKRQFAAIGDLEPDHPTILSFIEDPEKEKWLTVGQGIFMTNCVSCHGRDGAGVSGPNMTDDHFLLVKQLTDVAKTVKEGSVSAGMPAWSNRLSTNEIVLVSAYVASLRGMNVAGKEAQGEVIAAWTDWPIADTE